MYLLIIATIILIAYYVQKDIMRPGIYHKVDSYGSIQIFDTKGNLIAILYKDRTIEYRKKCSFSQQIQIKNISDHFEDYL